MAKEARQGADSPDASASWIIHPRKERPLSATHTGHSGSLGPLGLPSEQPGLSDGVRRFVSPDQTRTFDTFSFFFTSMISSEVHLTLPMRPTGWGPLSPLVR